MVSPRRLTALFTVLALQPPAAMATSTMVERFDEAVARLAPVAGPSSAGVPRVTRSAADFSVERRLNIRLDFPGAVQGAMYEGLLNGETAVFTRADDYLDATVMRNGEPEVVSFNAQTDGAPSSGESARLEGSRSRPPRSVGPGHFEDPGAYFLHLTFVKHDDLADRSARELHGLYVAWWLADMARRVLPVEPLHASYMELTPLLTSVAYGDARALHTFEGTLKALQYSLGTHVDRTYKHKFVLLTANPPMPGTAGVAFEGGNEAIASVSGRTRIVAHEIGHMLGATHENAETRGWWGCETNMLAGSLRWRNDCLEYSEANRRAMRSYMRHGPDTVAARKMVDGPEAP